MRYYVLFFMSKVRYVFKADLISQGFLRLQTLTKTMIIISSIVQRDYWLYIHMYSYICIITSREDFLNNVNSVEY